MSKEIEKTHAEKQKEIESAIIQVDSLEKYLLLERMHDDQIKAKRVYIDLAGDLAAGILLGQILYWFTPKRNGQSRVSIEQDGKTWLAKTRKDWWKEIRLTPKQFDRAAWILEQKGLIESNLYAFNGKPTKHLRPNDLTILEGVKSILTKGEYAISPNGKLRFAKRVKRKYTKGEIASYTEITAETTTKNTSENTSKDIAPNGAPTKIPSVHQQLTGVIAEVCGHDLSVKTQASSCGRTAAAIAASKKYPATPELVLEKYGEGGWWYQCDFRGRGGSPPTPPQVVQTWGVWEKSITLTNRTAPPDRVKDFYNDTIKALREDRKRREALQNVK